jgi:hypothetical protein
MNATAIDRREESVWISSVTLLLFGTTVTEQKSVGPVNNNMTKATRIPSGGPAE